MKNKALLNLGPMTIATYKFLNVKTHSLYSDKLTLAVLDLNRGNLATKEAKDVKLEAKNAEIARLKAMLAENKK